MQLTSFTSKAITLQLLRDAYTRVAEKRSNFACAAIQEAGLQLGTPELARQLYEEFTQLFIPTIPPGWLSYVTQSPNAGYAIYGFWGPALLPDPRGKESAIDNTYARECRLTALGLFLSIIEQQEVIVC